MNRICTEQLSTILCGTDSLGKPPLTYPAELKQHHALGMRPILHMMCPEGFPPWDADCVLLLLKKYQGCFLMSWRMCPTPKHICTAS